MKYIILLLLTINTCYGQTLTGIYNIYFKKTTNGRTLSKEIQKPITFSYIFSNNVSLKRQIMGGGVTAKDTLIVDEFGKVHEVNAKTYMPSNSFYFLNFTSKKVRMEQTVNNKTIAIKDSIPILKWTLINEEVKEIAGYQCKKATTENPSFGFKGKITVWYTEDIPINDGPQAYTGLPGLILEVNIGDLSTIRFEKLNFFPEKNTTIVEPEPSIAPLTLAQYQVIHGKGK